MNQMIEERKMSLRSLSRIRRILLAACVSVTVAGLGIGGGLAALELSPGHGRLVKLLKAGADSGRETLRPAAVGVRDHAAVVRIDDDSGEPSRISAAGRRVYREPTRQARQMLLEGLAARIRSMPAGDFDRDIAALAGYRGLLGDAATVRLVAGDDGDGMIPLPLDAVEEVEPNDDWPGAQPLALGDTLSGSAVPFADIDVFSFQGQAGQYVRIEALPLEADIYGTAYAIVRLFGPDSMQVHGGFYALYEDVSVQSADVSSRLIWPGGNIVAASLDSTGTYHVVVEVYPGDIRWLDGGMLITEDGDYEQIAYRLTLDTLTTGKVDGLVTDEGGGAVEGAVVELWSRDGIGGARAVTDIEGRFSRQLPAGTWGVYIEGPEGGPYPSGQNQREFVHDGAATSVTFELARGVVFSGRIETDRGEAAPYVGFSLIDTVDRQYRWGQSDEQGDFSVAVFPGTFDLYLHPGYLYPPQPVIEGVVIESDTTAVIVLDSGLRVSGALLDADGEPLPETWVTFYGQELSRWVMTSTEGEYTINLPEGRYWADVRPAVELLVPAQVAGPFDITEDIELDIELARGAILGGSVYDDRGSPVAGAQINLWQKIYYIYLEEPTDSTVRSDDGIIYFNETGEAIYPDLVDPAIWAGDNGARPQSYFQLRTDEKGMWRIALLGGEYSVDVVAPYPYPSQRVTLGTFTLEEGREVDAGRVEITYGVLFSGRVMIDPETPLAWTGFNMVAVKPEPEDDGGITLMLYRIPAPSLWVNTDGDGAFGVQVLPGTYNLMFDPRYSAQQFPVQWIYDVDLSADAAMDIVLEAGYTLSGRTVDEFGSGLSGSRLDFYEETGAWRGTAYTGGDGAFKIGLATGDYNVLVTPVKGYFPDSTSYAVSVDSDRQIEIVLRRGVRVYGRVTARDGHPLGRVSIQLLPHFDWPSPGETEPAETRVSLASHVLNDDSDGDAAVYYPYPQPVTRSQFMTFSDPDGEWELFVRRGAYDLFAAPSIAGFANAFLPNLDCSGERRIDLVLEQTEIVFEGMVTDQAGRPAPGTLVSLFDPASGGHVSAFTDEAGRFRLDLPMGDYEMFIEAPAGNSELPTSDRLKLDGDRQVLIQLGRGLLDSSPGTSLPRSFALSQNVPNPFNPSTTISYALEQQARVNLAVYNLRGRTVAVLVDKVQGEGD
ncbi:MAG: carboxypeptidase regulatory-like domain-containing protein, partial [Candidatus Glassbacteria bacterium]|nr:carboxypeptidase regulatory-like domain-containing protein [Candidatus Glassbacteria bacterium]